ncbi:MAG: 1-acyl-sn-glycerol-3-phosphate acyltransferase [Pseudomonadota bacterium]
MNARPDPDASPVGTLSPQHIVDELIEERAVKLRRSRLWPLYRALLYPLLLYKPAVRMADAVSDLDAKGVFEHISKLLALKVKTTGLENIPHSGRVLIASTHPTGIPDGIAMYDAIKSRRPDMTFFANRDAARAAPGIKDMIIPVEWVQEKRTRLRSRETLESLIKAFAEEKCVVLFPSGRLAFMDDDKQLTEQEWLASVAIFARKYECPIVPAHIEMRNSWLYYWFWDLNTELRDITLFHELLNKKNKTYRITFGPAIAPETLAGDSKAVADALREHAMTLKSDSAPSWRPVEEQAPNA